MQTQEVTEDPVIAADSFTYERSAIAAWLRHHDTSPMVRDTTPGCQCHHEPRLLELPACSGQPATHFGFCCTVDVQLS